MGFRICEKEDAITNQLQHTKPSPDTSTGPAIVSTTTNIFNEEGELNSHLMNRGVAQCEFVKHILWTNDKACTPVFPAHAQPAILRIFFLDYFTSHVGEHRTVHGLWKNQGIPFFWKIPTVQQSPEKEMSCLRHVGDSHVGKGAIVDIPRVNLNT